MMRKVGLPVLPSRSHNLPVMAGGAHPWRQVAKELPKRQGIYVQPTGAPTAPRGDERLPITPTPLPTEETMRVLVQVRAKVVPRLDRGKVSLVA